MTIQEILTQINHLLRHHSESPVLDSQVLLANILGKSRAWVVAHPDFQVDGHQQKQIQQATHRMEHGEPLPYIIGHWEFYGLDFHLTPEVLIPRPETELLVERGIDWLHQHPGSRYAIDVGTGSGCLAIALAMNIPDLHVLMTDISTRALEVARENVDRFNLSKRLELRQADLLDGIERTFDLICANLPYIPGLVLNDLTVSKSEPRLALDGGQGGIELITRMLGQSRDHLASDGLLVMEIESSQGAEVKSHAQALFPTSKVQILKDLSSMERCLEIERFSFILHVCPRDGWLKAQEQGVYISKSIEQEGFMHCSTLDQILQVANRFYRGIPDLILLWIDPARISSPIRWESAEGAIYPHIYGPINNAAVMMTTDLNPDIDGYYRDIQTPV